MIVRSFLDSNVFICADDHHYPEKQAIAAWLYERARASGLGVVSTRVMREYFSVVVGKIGVPPKLVRQRVELMTTLDVAPPRACRSAHLEPAPRTTPGPV
jgi:predicted nucleic acid-binding protein